MKLILLQDLHRRPDRVHRAAGAHLSRHHAPDLDLRQGVPLRVGRHADVAVGDHPDDPGGAVGLLDHRNAAAVTIPHDARGRAERVVGAAGPYVPRHELLDFHCGSPSDRWGQPTATLISCAFGCLLFGSVTSSMPFFSSAVALVASTLTGSGTERWKVP